MSDASREVFFLLALGCLTSSPSPSLRLPSSSSRARMLLVEDNFGGLGTGGAIARGCGRSRTNSRCVLRAGIALRAAMVSTSLCALLGNDLYYRNGIARNTTTLFNTRKHSDLPKHATSSYSPPFLAHATVVPPSNLAIFGADTSISSSPSSFLFPIPDDAAPFAKAGAAATGLGATATTATAGALALRAAAPAVGVGVEAMGVGTEGVLGATDATAAGVAAGAGVEATVEGVPAAAPAGVAEVAPEDAAKGARGAALVVVDGPFDVPAAGPGVPLVPAPPPFAAAAAAAFSFSTAILRILSLKC